MELMGYFITKSDLIRHGLFFETENMCEDFIKNIQYERDLLIIGDIQKIVYPGEERYPTNLYIDQTLKNWAAEHEETIHKLMHQYEDMLMKIVIEHKDEVYGLTSEVPQWIRDITIEDISFDLSLTIGSFNRLKVAGFYTLGDICDCDNFIEFMRNYRSPSGQHFRKRDVENITSQFGWLLERK